MPTKVFCLILNYKNYSQSFDCLKALKKSSLPKGTHFLLLDNTPLPDYDALTKFSAQKATTVILNGGNLGFAAGNNVGVRYALKQDATHILIINPDVTVGKNFLIPLLDHLYSSGAHITAPAIKHSVGKTTLYGLEGHLDPLLAKATHTNLRSLPSSSLRPAEFVTFACVLIDIKVFQKQLLDERYFMYLEDVDFCLSAQKNNFKIVLDPSVVVSHITSSSFTRPTQKLPISFLSQLKFITKWFSLPTNLIAYIYTLLFYPYLFILWEVHAFRHRS